MIDHISFSVKNFKQSQDFYDKTLSILDYERLMNFDTEEYQVAGYGKMASHPFGSEMVLLQVRMKKLAKQKGFMLAFWPPMLHLFINGMKNA